MSVDFDDLPDPAGPGWSWSEFTASLKWLEAEGFVERFYDAQGQECIRIAPGAENAEL